MERRNNVVDFAAYRFARDLRLKDASEASALADELRPQRPPAPLTDQAAAHRARMLEHLSANQFAANQSIH